MSTVLNGGLRKLKHALFIFLIVSLLPLGLFNTNVFASGKNIPFINSSIISANAFNNANVRIYDRLRGKIRITGLNKNSYVQIEANIPVAGLYSISIQLENSREDGIISIENNGEILDIPYKKGDKSIEGKILLSRKKGTFKISALDSFNSIITGLSINICSAKYEAEAGITGGYATVQQDDNSSGGAKVIRIGGPDTQLGSVKNIVYAPKDGLYGLIIKYYQIGTKGFSVSVNGEAPVDIEHRAYGDDVFTSPGLKYMEAALNQGENTIRIYSDKEYSLDLDCIILFSEPMPLHGQLKYSSATLRGSAQIRRCYGAQTGYVVSNLGNESFADFPVTSGNYNLRIWYSSWDYRELEIFIDGVKIKSILCPVTAEDFKTGTIDTEISVPPGSRIISFGNRYSKAPDIERILLTPSDKTDTAPVSNEIITVENGTNKIVYDMGIGKADYYSDETLRVEGIQSAVKWDEKDTVLQTDHYSERQFETTEIEDAFGEGKVFKVINTKNNTPSLIQYFYLYNTLPYILVKVELEHDVLISTNFMAPITSTGSNSVKLDSTEDLRFIFTPFDNDNWVRYDGDSLNDQKTSYWVSSVYDNTSRNSVVVGSIDHDTWKTGVSAYGDGDSIGFLGGFAGITSMQYTYDYLPHGSIDGTVLSSPRMFIGYFDDWRDGMEAYGSANSINNPPLNWEGGTPFGYNSWYAQLQYLNLPESLQVSDFIRELSDNDFHDGGVSYINLDSYWDNLTDEQLRIFVEKCRSNGQKAGIYWSHFVFWATNMSWRMGELQDEYYTFADAALRDSDGGVVAMAKDSGNLPLDPTSPAMEARLKYYMEKFVNLGFEFLKIDFLNYPSVEGEHYDKSIKTGMQAYNYALELFTKYVDTDKFFLSYSIAPLFPYQYGHARRIACDTAGDIGEISYMLNSLTYAWWTDDYLYAYADPDHLSLKYSTNEAISRYNSGAITGTMMLLSDKYNTTGIREITRMITSNKAINDIARMGRAFRPVEGNTGNQPTNLFTLSDSDSDSEDFYLAVFDYSRTSGGTVNVDLERIGLLKGVDYVAEDLWSKTKINIKDSFTVNLLPSQSTIYKIQKAR